MIQGYVIARTLETHRGGADGDRSSRIRPSARPCTRRCLTPMAGPSTSRRRPLGPCSQSRADRPSRYRKRHFPRIVATVRHPEKAHRPDNPIQRKPDWIRVKAPTHPSLSRDPRADAGQPADHGVRGSGLPEYRRVLDAAPRHHDDHGRHLHPRLRLLQCRAPGMPGALDAEEPAPRRRCGGEAGPAPCGDHLGGSRRPGRWRGGAFRRRHQRHPRGRAGHHHRSADAGFPAQAGRHRDRDGGQARTCSTTIWRRCRGFIRPSGRARAISSRCGCWTGQGA